MRFLHVVYASLVLIALIQSVFYYGQTPEVMASHFDGVGVPNGWSSKGMFFGIYLGVLAMNVAIFAFMPQFIGLKHLNLSHPSYWSSPARKTKALALFRTYFLWFGVANILLAIYVVQLVLDANLRAKPILDSNIWWALGAYGLFVVGWLARFFLIFRRKPTGVSISS